jgi:hypothetical protein
MPVNSVRYNLKFFYLGCSLASKVKLQQLRVACSNRFKFNGTVCPGKLPGKAAGEHPTGTGNMIACSGPARPRSHVVVPEPELEWGQGFAGRREADPSPHPRSTPPVAAMAPWRFWPSDRDITRHKPGGP